MVIFLELSNDFISHYQKDSFVESLERIRADLLHSSSELCSGNYEIELLDEFIRCFPESYYSLFNDWGGNDV